MNLPNLPTDNLYKFIALSGVVILLTSVILLYVSNKDIKYELAIIGTEVEELKVDSEILTIQRQHLFKEAEEIKKRLSQSKVLADPIQHKNDQNLEYLYSRQSNLLNESKLIEQLIDKDKELNIIEYEQKRKSQKILSKLKINNLKSIELDSLLTRWLIFSLLGLVLMGYGFTYWYHRVQKLLDQKLMIDLKNSNNVMATKRSLYGKITTSANKRK